MRTIDELSELEECIDAACRALPGSCAVVPDDGAWPIGSRMVCCPLGALGGGFLEGFGYPTAASVERCLGIPSDFAAEFINAFGGTHEIASHNQAALMGRRFRERALRGDYAKAGAR